jgi:rfaE bifunctional protein nucleotidyltransferase chain/domain
MKFQAVITKSLSMKNQSKIIELNDLQSYLLNISVNKVGLCHGVFDLLHIGHIKYLEEAKSLCDVLIVTLTQDKNVNKGPGRPAFNENQRAEAISALECIDFVAINHWPTSIETIELLKPNLYIKGPDYNNLSDDITGNILKEKSAVEKIGGELIFTSGETHSSSTLINQIKRNNSKFGSSWWDNERKNINFKEVMNSFDSVKNLKICVIGEDITDVYSNYRPLGRSSKGSSLVFEQGESETYDGGTLAVAKNLTAFHDDVTLITNKTGKKPIYNINRKNINLGNEIIKERILDAHTSEKVIEFYNNDFELTWDSDSEKIFLKYLNEKKFDLIMCVDFGHGFFTKSIIKAVESLDTFVALNVQTNAGNRGYNYVSKWNKADFVAITAEELSLTLQDKASTLDEKIAELKLNLDFKKIVITQGVQGSTFYDKNQKFYTPAFASSVIDRVGAGDTFLASIAGHIFLDQVSLNSIGLIGNLAAAQVLKHQANKEILNNEDLLKAIQHILK